MTPEKQGKPMKSGEDNKENGEPDSDVSGGGAINMHDPKDRGLVRTMLIRHPSRWKGIDPGRRGKWVEQLTDAGDFFHDVMQGTATNADGSAATVDLGTKMEAAKGVAGVVRTAVMIDRVEQKDEHRREDYDRIDNGKATRRIDVVNAQSLDTDPELRAAAIRISLALTGTPKSLPPTAP